MLFSRSETGLLIALGVLTVALLFYWPMYASAAGVGIFCPIGVIGLVRRKIGIGGARGSKTYTGRAAMALCLLCLAIGIFLLAGLATKGINMGALFAGAGPFIGLGISNWVRSTERTK